MTLADDLRKLAGPCENDAVGTCHRHALDPLRRGEHIAYFVAAGMAERTKYPAPQGAHTGDSSAVPTHKPPATHAERVDAIWAAYERTLLSALDAFGRAVAPIWAAYDRAIADARAARDAALRALGEP